MSKRYRLLQNIYEPRWLIEAGSIFHKKGTTPDGAYTYGTYSLHPSCVEGNYLWFKEIKEETPPRIVVTHFKAIHLDKDTDYTFFTSHPIPQKKLLGLPKVIEDFVNQDEKEMQEAFLAAIKLKTAQFEQQAKEKSNTQELPPCKICGGPTVLIRGKHPNSDKRNVCPQCTTERLEQIEQIANPNYGQTSKS